MRSRIHLAGSYIGRRVVRGDLQIAFEHRSDGHAANNNDTKKREPLQGRRSGVATNAPRPLHATCDRIHRS